MNDQFVHSLRLQLTPDDRIDERCAELIAHCKKYGFGDVMLMINAEEFNFGHITTEQARPWVEKLKVVREALLREGICVSVNNWIEMGHLARGRRLQEGQNFTTMVDMNGLASEMVACPLDTEWQDYFCEYAGYLVKELEPDYFWIEDDFRYHNHAPLEFGGCFCEHHIIRFNELLGTSYTREQFVEKAFAKGKPTRERKVWLDVERESLVTLADKITRAVKKASPRTKVALMSSAPDSHCMEARDWQGLLDALSQGGEQINRIHLPAYNEVASKDYIYNFNRVSMAIRHLSGDKTRIWPEVENGTPNAFRKSPRFFRFQIEGSMPLILDGMTYSIYGFCGNGVLDALGYGDEVRRLSPYLSAVRERKIRFSSMSGVTVPMFEDICYNIDIENGFWDLKPSFVNTAAYLSSLGISYTFSSERGYKGRTVALFSDSVFGFTDEELFDLFENNYVMVDGFAVNELCRRGLGSLVGAAETRELELENPTYAYESLEEDTKILGVYGYRSSIREDMGRLFSVKYDADADVRVLSYVHSCYGEVSANSFAKGKGFLVIPYMVEKKHGNQFCELRRTVIKDFVLEHTDKVICTENSGIHPYLYVEESRTHVMVTNATLDDLDGIRLEARGLSPNKVLEIKHDGKTEAVDFEWNGQTLVVKTELPHLSCVTLILE